MLFKLHIFWVLIGKHNCMWCLFLRVSASWNKQQVLRNIFTIFSFTIVKQVELLYLLAHLEMNYKDDTQISKQ